MTQVGTNTNADLCSELMTPEGLCLDDDTVLEILMEIPSLANDTQIFWDILQAFGCRPEGLFYMCFSFDPCSTAMIKPAMDASIQAPESLLCGCFDFSFQASAYNFLFFVSE